MRLHYVDPYKQNGLWYKALESWGRSRPGQFVARRVFYRIDPWLFRATGGRYPSIMGGMSTAPLISTGAKTGMPREHQLTYFHDKTDPILIASNAGGVKHPQWYYNLKANPQCEFGDEPYLATEVTDADEYARLFGLAEKVYAGYGDYRTKTAAAGRTIPIFRLTAR
jgi:deazaflavin-dependent oxidoreductase (nitroreductase family)